MADRLKDENKRAETYKQKCKKAKSEQPKGMLTS